MPGKTDIQWTGYSSNPLKLKLHATGKLVNACIPCSAGCRNCYAGRITGRWWDKAAGDYPGYGAALMKKGEWVLNDRELHAMLTFRAKPKEGQDRPRVFIGDMTDVFGEWVQFELIDRLFAVFALRPDVDWQVLTKRPERMAEYLSGIPTGRYELSERIHVLPESKWPLPNVWLGTSVEDQQRADERIPHLLRCPAAVRFLSCEPLLGEIDLANVRHADGERVTDALRGETVYLPTTCIDNEPGSIDWVIVGGESGAGARRFDLLWADSLYDQCEAAGCAYFLKQIGANAGWTDADGDWHAWKTKDSHGGNPAEWPETFKWARQFPATAAQAK